jgi:hypothetical protein
MIRTIIVFLLLTLSGFTADFLDTKSQCLNMVKQNLNWELTKTDQDSLIFKDLKEAAIIISCAAKARIFWDTITTSAYVIDYDLDTNLITVEDASWHSSDLFLPLKYNGSGTFDTLLAHSVYSLKGESGADGLPKYFDWKYNSTKSKITMTLYPPPAAAGYNIIIRGLAKVRNIQTDTSFMATFPVAYRPAITTYATVKRAVALGMSEKVQIYSQLLQMQLQILGATVSFPVNVK